MHISRIKSALGHKIFSLGTCLDVEGAFDNTSFQVMGRACDDHDVHFTISRWIAAMLSDHMVWAEKRGVSSTMMVGKGCPREGVLSRLL
jgi:hypothetical protein